MQIVIVDGKTTRTPTETEDSILGFFPPYRWMSNYHLVKITMPDGLTYPSTENAYQAHKLLSVDERIPFTNCSPGESKKMGGTVNLRKDWELVKVDVMRTCLEAKFKDQDLMKMLKQTAPKYLEETNNWSDTYWGVCNGKGQNQLGRLLMEIRDRG